VTSQVRESRYASVCLLSFNRAKLIKQTIETAIANARYPFELIVHDDGSDMDTTELLIDMHENGMISLLMLNAPGNNEGQGVALNRMFGSATGDPIVKMDQDMALDPGWLQKSVELLEANDAHAWGESRLDLEGKPRIGALGLFKYEHDPVDFRKMLIAHHTTQGIEWEEHQDFVGSAMVIPRSCWEEFGPFEERSPAFAEDAVFKQRIAGLPGWCCALFPDDLAVNVGFGVGPSTVNVMDGDNLVVQSIHDKPLLLGADF